MNTKLYYGNKKEVTYTGFAGNIFGVPHDKVIEEGLYFVKIGEHEYIELDELLAEKKQKKMTVIKDFATKRGEIFVCDLILVDDLILTKVKTRNKEKDNI